MATPEKINAQGTIISISADGTTWTPVGCITGWDLSASARAEIDTTCLVDTSKSFKFGLKDNGTLSIDYFYDPEGAGQKLMEASYGSDTAYHFQIEYPNLGTGGKGTIKVFEGYVIELSETGAVDEVLTASASIKISGDVTQTPPTTT